MKNTWPHFSVDEISAVVEILNSGKVNYWTGTQGKLFEKEFAEYMGCSYGITIANGTLALDLALEALNIGLGDEVIVTPRSFMASASSIALRGAKPVFVDVDPESQNITLESIRLGVSLKTKAIILVHLAGWPCDLYPIINFAKEEGIRVIEDCAQAHGAKYDGRYVGSFGDVAAFSFCQDKIMSTGGEGGMVVTSDGSLFKRMWSYKDHGKNYDLIQKNVKSIGYRWLHDSFGTNYRLTEIQSAIGRIQLKKLQEWVLIRRKNAQTLNEIFSKNSKLRITLPDSTKYFHSYYKYYVFLKDEYIREGQVKKELLSKCMDLGLPIMSGSCSELYLEKAFDKLGPWDTLPVAKKLDDSGFMLMVDHCWNEKDLVDLANKFLEIVDSVV